MIEDEAMKSRALEWFDKHGSVISSEDVVERPEGEEKERPTPAFIRSDQMPQEEDEVRRPLDERIANDQMRETELRKEETKKDKEAMAVMAEILASLATDIRAMKTDMSSIKDVQSKHMLDITELKSGPAAKRKIIRRRISDKMKEKQSERMKQIWAERKKKEGTNNERGTTGEQVQNGDTG